VTGIIAQTEFAKQVMYSRIKHPNITVIGNPIRNIPYRGQTRKNIILNVGRFVSTKRQSLIIKMFSELETGDWTLMFLGDGHMLGSCKDLVENLGLTEKVVFAGQVGNTDDYYRMSKIFAFTSNSEGFPNVLGEAQSAGLAIITFDFEAGANDLVENNVNGLLIPEGDIEAYKTGLQRLMDDEELRTSLSKNASKTIARFERNLICEKYHTFFLGNNAANLSPVISFPAVKLSIIIPVYNVREYIEKCLFSCLDQDMDYHQFEIIVINDGSTDDTLSRALEIAKKYRNIKIIEQENCGPAAARNRGINEAIGEYLWFIDGDDWIDKNCYRSLYNIASENALDLLWIRSRRINGSKNSLRTFPPRTLNKKIHNGVDFLDKVFSLYCFSTHFLIKRTFLLQTGCTFTKGIIYEDTEFMPRVIMRAERVKYEAITCYNYLKRDTSLINTPDPRKIDNLLYVIGSNIKIINSNSNKKVIRYYKRLQTHLVLIMMRLSSHSFYQKKQKCILSELHMLKIRKLKLIGPLMNFISSSIFNLSPNLLVMFYNIGRKFDKRRNHR
jgi:glycosyltransferase involved in cell wall biosynthesis